MAETQTQLHSECQQKAVEIADEVLPLLCIRPTETLQGKLRMELPGQSHCKLNLLCPSPLWSPILNKLCGTVFNSVSITNQVILWLNYLCQELNARLHEQCVHCNKN